MGFFDMRPPKMKVLDMGFRLKSLEISYKQKRDEYFKLYEKRENLYVQKERAELAKDFTKKDWEDGIDTDEEYLEKSKKIIEIKETIREGFIYYQKKLDELREHLEFYKKEYQTSYTKYIIAAEGYLQVNELVERYSFLDHFIIENPKKYDYKPLLKQ